MTRADLADRLAERCAARGVPCAREVADLLATYLGLLTKWNKTINLTAFQLDPMSDEAIDRLIVEPLVAAKMIQGILLSGGQAQHLVDLGSGGGSPAIPLKMACPGLRLSMVESKTRKSAFLREAIRQLHLFDSVVLTVRMEDIETDQSLHQAAQTVSVRAVRMDEAAWRAIGSLLSPGGTVVWFRSHAEGPAFPASFARESSSQLPDDKGEILLLRKQGRQ